MAAGKWSFRLLGVSVVKTGLRRPTNLRGQAYHESLSLKSRPRRHCLTERLFMQKPSSPNNGAKLRQRRTRED
jgi:hypothetical protein